MASPLCDNLIGKAVLNGGSLVVWDLSRTYSTRMIDRAIKELRQAGWTVSYIPPTDRHRREQLSMR